MPHLERNSGYMSSLGLSNSGKHCLEGHTKNLVYNSRRSEEHPSLTTASLVLLARLRTHREGQWRNSMGHSFFYLAKTTCYLDF